MPQRMLWTLFDDILQAVSGEPGVRLCRFDLNREQTRIAASAFLLSYDACSTSEVKGLGEHYRFLVTCSHLHKQPGLSTVYAARCFI